MKLYISDLHFGHRNVIMFDHRPFKDREEMDNTLIHLWNGRVQNNDDVYVLGDFCYRSDKTADWYLRQLKGRKHLVIGNHDGDMLNNPKAMSYFETVDKMQQVTDGDKQICLCHFPIAEWDGMRKGYWHVHGHIHNRREDAYEFFKMKNHVLNAGCMINNYTPVSFDELVRNNRYFREKGDTHTLDGDDIMSNLLEICSRFERENGRLLTEEEAVQLIGQIRKEIHARKDDDQT